MKTTFRIPVVILALAASLCTAVSLGSPSPVASGVDPVSTEGAALGPQAGQHSIADAFPTAEARFAIRRPVVDRP